MDISVILNQMLILFFFIFLGVLLNRTGIINTDFNQRITKIIIHVTMPCMILASVASQDGARDMHALIILAVVGIVFYIIVLPIIAFLMVHILPVRPERQGLYMFMTIYSNVGFMGFPVLNAIYGPKAVFYAAIINIIFNISIYTYGVIIMHYKKEATAALSIRSILSPGVSLSVFAVFVYIFRIPFPAPLTSALTSLGDMTVPLAMMVIGATLGTMHLKELFNDWALYPYILFRQFILPLAAFPLLRFFLHDELILGVSFILLMMPVANTAVLFANLYDGDTKLAAKGVFFTTLLSIVSIPLLIYFCL